ncbi:ROK family protein [Burkholderia sp. Ac-20353]|uniref:ROK family protein n=1 Tax=Burkholderia sp. Ac-20353 TaxID=2703894 RepID=UPI00197C92D6|nr:ROK family protein [Burkholderia sp. Ac-20353]
MIHAGAVNDPAVSWGIGSDKARILSEVLQGRAASRQELVQILGLRSTSVSEFVGELLEQRLLVETVNRRPTRGRPTLALVGNSHRLAVLVFHVIGQSIQASVVNLLGQTTAQVSAELPPGCDNARIAESFDSLRTELVEHTPETTDLAGASFSLPGLIDAENATWIFSSRWPQMRRLDLRKVLRKWNKPVFAYRNLDAELRARLMYDSTPSDRTLLVHWGYGIGAAFALKGVPIFGGAGGFGEIGHWRVSQSGARCRCGRTGCLETESALWAVGPKLLGSRFNPAADESATVLQLEEMDLSSSTVASNALDSFVLALGNLCRVLFPTRIIVSGPFVANLSLRHALRASFEREGVLLDLPIPELICDHQSRRLELAGAAGPALGACLQRMNI